MLGPGPQVCPLQWRAQPGVGSGCGKGERPGTSSRDEHGLFPLKMAEMQTQSSLYPVGFQTCPRLQAGLDSGSSPYHVGFQTRPGFRQGWIQGQGFQWPQL